MGHAEQFTNHQRWDGQGECRHQISWRAVSFHFADLLCHDLGDPRLKPSHPPGGEFSREHPPQSLMLGRVEPKEVSGPRIGGLIR